MDDDFTRRWWQAMEVLYETATQLVLYGVFLPLFVLAIRHLRHSGTSNAPRLLAVAWFMLALATTQVALDVSLSVLMLRLMRFDVRGDNRDQTTSLADRISFVHLILLITNNALTDGLYIIRCYVVWERRMFVIVLPVLVLAATTVIGYISATESNYLHNATFSPKIPYILSASSNVLLTVLTGGRIWWLGREMRGNLSAKDYNTAAAMILESGAIYSVFVIAYLITEWVPAINTPSSAITVIHYSLLGALPQIINIAPTLIIARVGLSGTNMTVSEPVFSTLNLSFVPIGGPSFPNG